VTGNFRLQDVLRPLPNIGTSRKEEPGYKGGRDAYLPSANHEVRDLTDEGQS